ncbi:polysaccharide biosynthesis/export family protein [Sphingomonas sp. R86521]|uniref:polysaccharide biosynthesis/export family protein n=1 Tax=Sphingomonas sp. R86521 TaxID=3093860 RepID=UPI0036D2CB76
MYGSRATSGLALVASISLAGCSTLPSSGPTAGQIASKERQLASTIGYAVVDLNDGGTLPPSQDNPSLRKLAALARSGRVDLVGPGDILQITLFEIGVSLFGSTPTAGFQGAVSDPSARAQTLSGIVVEQDGHIRLPYIGRLAVAGRTPDEIQRMIVNGLRGKSQAPQALVTVTRDMTNTVVVSGAAAKPGRVQLTLVRERLLDAIAGSGGTGLSNAEGPQSTIVQFTRQGITAEAYLQDIVAGSAADLVLVPGDRINLIKRPLSYLVFGAAGRVSQIPFDTNAVSLAEAVARAGGPDDNRADPTAVFLFRDAGSTASATPGALPAATIGTAPIVYRLDMTKPSSYFLAQRFVMRDKDVIYIANARINQTRKLVEIVNLLFTPVFTARAIAQ